MHKIVVSEGGSHLVVNSRIDIACSRSRPVAGSREYGTAIIRVLPVGADDSSTYWLGSVAATQGIPRSIPVRSFFSLPTIPIAHHCMMGKILNGIASTGHHTPYLGNLASGKPRETWNMSEGFQQNLSLLLGCGWCRSAWRRTDVLATEGTSCGRVLQLQIWQVNWACFSPYCVYSIYNLCHSK